MNERIATDARFYYRVISILGATSTEIAEYVKIRGSTIILPQLSHPWRQPLRQYIINSHLFKYWFYLTYYKKKTKTSTFQRQKFNIFAVVPTHPKVSEGFNSKLFYEDSFKLILYMCMCINIYITYIPSYSKSHWFTVQFQLESNTTINNHIYWFGI